MSIVKRALTMILVFMLLQTSVVFGKVNSPISLNFDNINTRSALQSLAQLADVNMIVSDKVKGRLNLHLKHLTWQQALKAILLSQDLSEENLGKIVFIAPAEEIAKQATIKEKTETLSPLKSIIVRLRYAKAQQIASLLKSNKHSLLSKRGSVGVDSRTNSLLIKDTSIQLQMLKPLLQKLDVPVKQVMITARIVNIDSDYEKELGIRFGLTSTGEISGVKTKTQLNIDLPAIASQAAHLGMALLSLTKGTLLDLELSALETEGHAEIISSPRLLTANQQEASIESGEEIPYQEQTSQGGTSITFKKAVLSLDVTPQIIPDGKIILHLKVNQDKPSSREVQGVPAVDTRELQTQVLVKNGQTVVLGGIYEESHSNQVERVPFFASLPIVGVLFQHRKVVDSRRELLIFVTPRVVE